MYGELLIVLVYLCKCKKIGALIIDFIWIFRYGVNCHDHVLCVFDGVAKMVLQI